MINKKTLPLVLLKTIENLYSSVRIFVSENNDILEILKDVDLEIVIHDKGKGSKFKFSISNPRYENNKSIFDLEYNPSSTTSINGSKLSTISDSLLTHLKNWTKLIRSYNEVNLSPEDKILNEYESEFFENFELIDEDADTNPYELEKQVIIHNFLAHTIEILSKNEKENKYLIQEAENLKESIPKLTKRTTVRQLSKLFAFIRQKSLPLLKEILVQAKKELYKRVMTGGFDFIGDIITLM